MKKLKTEEVLSEWSNACELVDIKWYIFRETLLCANGYHEFPDNLNGAQVVVFAEDLPAIMESVIPLLPETWKLDKKEFVAHDWKLNFKQNGETVLTIDVLYPVANEEEMSSLSKTLTQLRNPAANRVNLQRLFLRLLGFLLHKTFVVSRSKAVEKAFAKIMAFIGVKDAALPYYCDSITNKKPSLMDRKIFAHPETILCNGISYPVFSGYRKYLEAVYGDYENGLTDGVGVGLSVEEKYTLKQHQERCKEALAFLQTLSKEYGLNYYLIAGSVLGPIRHGGFIPWDDDVDIGIRVEELENFERIVKEKLPEYLPEGFTLEQSGADNPYPRMFSKICFDGRCCIDLWPLVPTYVSGMKAIVTWYFAKLITKAHYYKIGHEVTRYYKLAKLICMFLSDKQIMKLARWNERKYVGKNTPAYINIYSIYKRGKETIKREWLDTPATLNFDGMEVPVIGCTKQYLEHLYGNYMEFPAPWKRTSRHVARFNTAERKEELATV